MWNPKDYGNVTVLYVPGQLIWLPDVVLYNKYACPFADRRSSDQAYARFSADGNYQVTIITKATITYTGQVR